MSEANITFISAYGGYHNANLDEATARLHKQGLWDNLNTVVFTPAAHMMPTVVAMAWESLHYPPNIKKARLVALGKEVGFAYSQFVEMVLQHEVVSTWRYILTMEHDNVPQSDGLIRLMARMQDNPHLSAISGLYFTKGQQGYAHIWGVPDDTHFRPQLPATNNGLVECRGISMGFALFKIDMFRDERLTRPWFRTKADATGTCTHDLNFWDEAARLGYRCAVDCGVKVGHADVENRTIW